MWPMLGGLLSGVMGMFSASKSADQSAANTAMTIQANQQSQQEAEAFNAQQAGVGRDFNAEQADLNRQFQAQQAQQQMGFQENMANTAYQRSRADMVKAGLNPILAAGAGGAATPSGASASGATASAGSPTVSPMRYDYSGRQSAAAGMADAIRGIVPSAVALKTADATIDNLVEQNAVLSANERLQRVQAATQAELAGKTRQETINLKEMLPKLVNEAITAKNQSGIWPNVRSAADVSAFLGGRAGDAISPLLNSSKAVLGALPRKTTTERSSTGPYGDTSSFEERFSGYGR
ncbi:MAG: DNA pilot protein [Microviridae sp.]|nr:MAG: DNA pilot protein [Microviridae sp.]